MLSLMVDGLYKSVLDGPERWVSQMVSSRPEFLTCTSARYLKTLDGHVVETDHNPQHRSSATTPMLKANTVTLIVVLDGFLLSLPVGSYTRP